MIHPRSNCCFSGLAKAGSQIYGTRRSLERYMAEFGGLEGDVTGEGGPVRKAGRWRPRRRKRQSWGQVKGRLRRQGTKRGRPQAWETGLGGSSHWRPAGQGKGYGERVGGHGLSSGKGREERCEDDSRG